jgi:hypothetical protein
MEAGFSGEFCGTLGRHVTNVCGPKFQPVILERLIYAGESGLLRGLEKKAGFYLIACLENDSYYVGSANNIRKRIHEHIYNLLMNRHENQRLRHVFNKYSRDSFVLFIYECGNDERLLYEQTLIDNKLKGCLNTGKGERRGKSNKR